jgi:hypothetical protein
MKRAILSVVVVALGCGGLADDRNRPGGIAPPMEVPEAEAPESEIATPDAPPTAVEPDESLPAIIPAGCRQRPARAAG